MSRIEVILKATDVLNTLSIIDIQELLPYQSKLEDALQVLQRSVEAARAIQRESLQPGSSSLISSSTPLPSAPHSPRLLAEPDTGSGESECGSPIVSCSDRPTSHVTADALPKQNGNGQSGAVKLLLYLEDEKRSKKIRDYLSSSDCDPIDGSSLLDWTEEDPRVIDLRLCSSPSSSFGVKFRRGLSQRSLAAEYNQWEKETYNTSRVTELSQDPATSADHNGHIEDFLQVNAHRFKDQDSTRHGIKHGIRLLVFESICGYAGVSAILMLVYSKFRSVKYEEHLTMKGLLENTEWESLARDKSSWLVRCQERYDEKNRMWAEHQASWRATYGKMKRQRTASSDRQLSSSHRRRLSGTTTAEGDNARERGFQEPRTSPSEMGSDIVENAETVTWDDSPIMNTDQHVRTEIQENRIDTDLQGCNQETVGFQSNSISLQDSASYGQNRNLKYSYRNRSAHSILQDVLGPEQDLPSCSADGRIDRCYAPEESSNYCAETGVASDVVLVVSAKQPLAAPNAPNDPLCRGECVPWQGSSLSAAIAPSSGHLRRDFALDCHPPPKPLPSMVPQGQYTENEARLMGIYWTFIYQTRTLLEKNSYGIPLAMAESSAEIRNAVIHLASTYARDAVPNSDYLRAGYELRLVCDLKRLCLHLRDSASAKVLLTMTMLLIHHQVISGDDGWLRTRGILVTMQNQGIPFHNDPSALFIAYQTILDIFDPGENIHGGLNINWLQTWPLPDHVIDLGLSCRLLFFIGRTTELALSNNDIGSQEVMSLLGMIQGTDQLVSGVEGKAKHVVEIIALSYKHAAVLMLYCRLFGYTRSHSLVRSTARTLAGYILQLPPHDSEFYRAMDPLFSMLVCAMLCEPTTAEKIFIRMDRIQNGSINNVHRASNLLHWVLQWQDNNIQCAIQHGWFEEMRKSLPEEHHNVSLG